MNPEKRPMTFAERELRRSLTSAFELGICKTDSLVYLVPEVTGQDSVLANDILAAVRQFGDNHRNHLFNLVDFSNLDSDPSERQAQMAQDIVGSLWRAGEDWRPSLEELLRGVGDRIYVPLRTLLSLVAVHVTASDLKA